MFWHDAMLVKNTNTVREFRRSKYVILQKIFKKNDVAQVAKIIQHATHMVLGVLFGTALQQ